MEKKLKFVVLGDSGVGKTAFLKRYVRNTFSEDELEPTIQPDVYKKEIPYDPETNISLQIWDTAGQEQFQSLTGQFFRGATGALIMYASGNSISFNGALEWRSFLDKRVRLKNDKPVPCVLVATKDDLKESSRLSSEFNRHCGFLTHIRTSSKDGTNVTEAIMLLLQGVLEQIDIKKFKEEKEEKNANNKKSSFCWGNRILNPFIQNLHLKIGY